MSLILDALNRSQSERANPGDVPGIATAHYPQAAVRPGLWSQALLGLALVAALGGMVWLLVRPDVRDAGPQAEPAIAVVTTVAAPEAPATMPPPPVESVPPGAQQMTREGTMPLSPQIAELYARPPESSSSPSEPASNNPPEPSLAAVGSAPVDITQSTASTSASESNIDIETMLAMAKVEMGNQKVTQEHSAPFIEDLSQQRKDAIPTLLYSGHDYRDNGGSSVLINERSARVGSSVGKGVTVEEILPDSVVLRFDGEVFRLRALNSWVNL